MRDPLTRTLLVLTFVTGIVDAVSFLALGQVFAAMQTGNVIFLGLGFADISGAPLLAPLVALGAFLAGASAAALLTLPGAFRFARVGGPMQTEADAERSAQPSARS